MMSNKCCICQQEHLDETYDAQPVKEGKCCKACYTGVVVYQKFNLAGLTKSDYMYNVSHTMRDFDE